MYSTTQSFILISSIITLGSRILLVIAVTINLQTGEGLSEVLVPQVTFFPDGFKVLEEYIV
nr:MAG TPA: hypothetical protein [Bacteriophage sp.]